MKNKILISIFILIVLISWLNLKPVYGVCYSISDIPELGNLLPEFKVNKIDYTVSRLRRYVFAKMEVKTSEVREMGHKAKFRFIITISYYGEVHNFGFVELYAEGGDVWEAEDFNFLSSGNLLHVIYLPNKNFSDQGVLYLGYQY